MQSKSVDTSFTVEDVNLSERNDLEIDIQGNDSKSVRKPRLFDEYPTRPDSIQHGLDFDNMSFETYTKAYELRYESIYYRDIKKTEGLVRHFTPSYSPNPNGKNYWQYCRMLLKYKPWRDKSKLFPLENDENAKKIAHWEKKLRKHRKC